MLIIIDDSIFASQDPTKAVTLCVILANSRHIIYFDATTHAFKSWASTIGLLGASVRNYLQTSSAEIIAGSGKNKIVVHDGETDWRRTTATSQKIFAKLSHKDALKFCSMPAKIFVENAESDRAFILAFLNPQKRMLLELYEANGWVQFIHGGGIGDLKKHIQKEIQLFSGAAIRCYAIFDNDGLAPGSPSSHALAVSKLCAENSMPFHCLHRRCIENYLPINLIMVRKWKIQNHNGHTISLFSKLPESFRDHFNMKGGLEGDSKNKGEKPEFPIAHKYAIKKFAKGFGDKAWEGFTDKHFDTLARHNDVDIVRARKELDSPLKELVEQL